MLPRCPQSTCACLPGGVSNRRTATFCGELRCGCNQFFKNRVAASEPASAQFPKQHLRVPHARFQPLLDVRLERVQFAGPRWPRSVHWRPFRLQQVLAGRLSIEPGELADRLDAHPCRFNSSMSFTSFSLNRSRHLLCLQSRRRLEPLSGWGILRPATTRPSGQERYLPKIGETLVRVSRPFSTRSIPSILAFTGSMIEPRKCR